MKKSYLIFPISDLKYDIKLSKCKLLNDTNLSKMIFLFRSINALMILIGLN